MPKNRASRWVLAGLACQDVWHDKKISLCMLAAVISVVAPLLLLFGLKHGVVVQMRDALTSQPNHLEIRLIGSHPLDRAWFESIAKDPRTGFVMPMTRSLNTVADIRVSARDFLPNVELLASSDGDPLLRGQPGPLDDSHVWLSATAAQQLSVKSGDALRLLITRRKDNQREQLNVPLRIQGVLEPAVFTRPAALISLPLLTALENFRDGASTPAAGQFDFSVAIAPRDTYPRARLYAKTLDDVPSLTRDLLDDDIETVSKLADIESIQAVDRVLGLIFGVIAWLGAIGCAASLVGAFAANIDRKRKDLALLRLIGYERRTLLGYVFVQACLIAVAGFMVGLLLYAIGSYFFNSTLGQALALGQSVSLLSAMHLLTAFGLALLVATVVSLIGGWMAMRVQPSESLRDV